MGQVVGVFICFSYWQQPSPRCLPSWHPIAQATQQRSWPSEGRSDSARSHRRYASPLIDLKRANSSASQAECRGFDPLHPLSALVTRSAIKSIPVGRYAKRGEDVAHRRIARSCPRLARLVKDLGQALRIVILVRFRQVTRANMHSGHPDGPCKQG